MNTISKVAARFGLSRTTLLYYESIGLLIPASSTDYDYRIYSAADEERLAMICMYRDMKIPLREIKKLLSSGADENKNILEKQLLRLNNDIRKLRSAQQSILKIIASPALKRSIGSISKDDWIKFFRAAGLSDKAMKKWHAEFEINAPVAHHDFLESLGISASEIEKIRKGCISA